MRVQPETIDVQCPTCCMTARSSDYRHLRPLVIDSRADIDIRECRNCGATLSLTVPAVLQQGF
jgi:transcription elongation factor Elf1